MVLKSSAPGVIFAARALILTAVLAIFSWFCLPPAFAADILFENGDRLSGKLIEEGEDTYSLETKSMGLLTIKKEYVANVIKEEKDQPQPPPDSDTDERDGGAKVEKIWDGEIGAGFDRRRGNTNTTEMNADLLLHREIDREDKKNEFTLKGRSYYSAEDREMNARKHYGMIRYAFSLGQKLKWYNFYKFEGEHDRFSNIDYRLIPSTGVGYWFFDSDPVKLLLEGGVGISRTEYRRNKASETEGILIARFFYEQVLWGELTLSEDFTVYPSITETGEYRLRSEAALTHPVMKHFLLRLMLLDEYNSDPGAGTDKNDIRLTTSLVYSF